ncbi:hypothetical protein V8F06_003631 [Rhypophila decipiens]
MDPIVQRFEPTVFSYDEYRNSKEGRYSGANALEKRKPASTASLRQPSIEYATMERTSSVPNLEPRRRITANIGKYSTSDSFREQPKASSLRQPEAEYTLRKEIQQGNPVAALANSKNEISQSQGASRSGSGKTPNATKDYLSSAIDREVKFPPLKPSRPVSPPPASASNSREKGIARPDAPAPLNHHDSYLKRGRMAPPHISNTEECVEWCCNTAESVLKPIWSKIDFACPNSYLPRYKNEWRHEIFNVIHDSIYCHTRRLPQEFEVDDEKKLRCLSLSSSINVDIKSVIGQTVPGTYVWKEDTEGRCDFSIIIHKVAIEAYKTLPCGIRYSDATSAHRPSVHSGREERCENKKAVVVAKNDLAKDPEMAQISKSQKPGPTPLDHNGEKSRSDCPSTAVITSSAKQASSFRDRKASHNASSRGKLEPAAPAAAPPLGRASAVNQTDVGDRPPASPRLELVRDKPNWRERAAADVAAWCEKEGAKVAAVKQVPPIVDNQDASSPQLAATTPIQNTNLRGRKSESHQAAEARSMVSGRSSDKVEFQSSEAVSGPIGSINKTANREEEGVKGEGGSGSNWEEPIHDDEKFLRALVKEIEVSGSSMDAAEVPKIVDKITTGIPQASVHIVKHRFKLSLPDSVTMGTASKLVKLIPKASVTGTWGNPLLRLPLPVKTVESSTVQPTAVDTIDTKAHPDMHKSKNTNKDPAINSGSAKTKSTEADNDKCKRTKEEPVPNSDPAAEIPTEADNTKSKTSNHATNSTKDAADGDVDIDEYVMVEDDVPGGSSYIEDDWLVVSGDDGF